MNQFRLYGLRLIIILSFSLYFVSQKISFAQQSKDQELTSISNENAYLIGAGDSLLIEFVGINLFSGNYNVRPDSSIFLPEIGKVFVNDLTVDELKIILESKYSNFIKKPDINVLINSYRPINVTLRGEVNRTGLYIIPYYKNTLTEIDVQELSSKYPGMASSNTRAIPPKLFDLLKLGQGLSSNANLSEIIVTRKSSVEKGSKIRAKIDLIALLQNGDQSQNLVLRDGDDVLITRQEQIMIDQLIDFNKSNLTPDLVEVYINGNVIRPGKLVIKQGLSLYEAIAAAGGKGSMTGNVEFIRLKRNGQSDKRIFRFNSLTKKGTPQNPILISGDIVYVRKNLVGKTSNVLNEYTSPLVNAYGVYKIFD